MRPGPLAAASLRIGPDGLALSEQLVLAGLRSWAQARLKGNDPRSLVRPSLTHVASKSVASIFIAMMESLEREAARGLQIHCVACRGYSHDEQRVVLACGVSRASPCISAQLLAPLVRSPAGTVILARTLNVALGHAGFVLPVRLWDDEQIAAATIH